MGNVLFLELEVFAVPDRGPISLGIKLLKTDRVVIEFAFRSYSILGII